MAAHRAFGDDSTLMGQSISFGCAERTFVVAQGEEAPSLDDWEECLRALESGLAEIKGVLIFSAGGGMNAKQREQMAELVKRGGVRVAVLTDSRIVRGAVTAMSWSEVPIEAFDCSDEGRALDYLLVDTQARAAVLTALTELMLQVPSTVRLRAVRQRQPSGPRRKLRDSEAPSTRRERSR
jgi:hypothetical protein